MAWWQPRFLTYVLRYGLSHSGLFDDQALDLDHLDLKMGQKNIVELRDVGLNIQRLTKMLPPGLRVETARVLLLRITLPFDVYHESAVAELEGVDLVLRLEDEVRPPQPEPRRNRSPATARTPQHRKTQRRLHSPPPYDPDGFPDPHDDIHLPTADEIAQSFLRHEPPQEREELEATLAETKGMEESIASESSEGGDVGTGIGVTMPGFLATIVRGLIDKVQAHVKDVRISIKTDVPGGTIERVPLTLRLRIGAVDLDALVPSVDTTAPTTGDTRTVKATDISLELLSTAAVLADLSDLPSHSSSLKSRSVTQSTRVSEESFTSAADEGTRRSSASTHGSAGRAVLQSSNVSSDQSSSRHRPPSPSEELLASVATVDADRFADAGEDELQGPQSQSSELDIQAGDDNISWGSRRSKSSAPAEDLWRSMVSEQDLPDPLMMAPEGGLTSPAHSSRDSSPYSTREGGVGHASHSSFQGPGSWPRLDESSQRHRHHQGPGSSPALDQSQHSAFEPLAQVLTAADDDITDNKKAALEQVGGDEQAPESPSVSIPDMDEDEEYGREGREEGDEQEESISDDMLQSRVFSHEEAQSMYMSAMTNSPTLDMPGGWGVYTQSELPISGRERPTDDVRYTSDGQASGNITPRAETPRATAPRTDESPDDQVARELMFIDSVSVSVPTDMMNKKSTNPEPSPSLYGAHSAQASRAPPGAFSVYSERSKWQGTGSIYGEASRTLWATREPPDAPEMEPLTPLVEVSVGDIRAQVDVATGRLLYALANKTASLLETEPAPPPKSTDKKSPIGVQRPIPAVLLCVKRATLSLREEGFAFGHDVLTVAAGNVELSNASDICLDVGTLKVLLGGQDLLAFTHDHNNFTTSQVLSKHTPDVTVKVKRCTTATDSRQVTELSICTASISFLLDLAAIDASFDAFGGLSGMLELGSSILSESGASSPILAKSSKEVRFAGDTNQTEQPKVAAEVKVNMRIHGITITLKAAPCSAVLQTSTVKAVRRTSGVSATVERVLLSGPLLPDQNIGAAISLDLASARVEYAHKADHKDIERLISLLTPSKDKYDGDDDIIIANLLPQRKTAGVLRAVVSDIKVRVDSWDCLSALEDLGNDLARLSAVTKYLPEDDRPGVLTLVLIKNAEARMPLNERFGTLRFTLQDLHLAHVGIPELLLAFSISNVNLSQLNGPELIHALIPIAGSEGLPMVMARMLGEMEPTIKIKLFNACVEYSVPVLLDITGMDKAMDAEELVTGLAQSIAVMVDRTETTASDPSSTPPKRINLSLLVHNSAIGLNPQKLQSKALLVLTDTHFTTVVPPEDTLNAKLDLRKASIFITDRVVDRSGGSNKTIMDSANTTQRLRDSLIGQGFVSVGDIRSATIDLRVEEHIENGSKMVEVDVKNELILLETCADSTQTLIATLSGLVPPTPPSKQPKYLTEPMTIEDMMASFTGDPFAKPDLPPETLFDVEVDQDEEPDMLLGVSGLSETDDLLAQSGMTSSLYGPIGGVYGMNDEDEVESTIGEEYPKTVESFLEEEDPFEMASAPTDGYLNDDNLLRDLKRQCRPTTRDEPIDLELYEVEDLGYDALGSGQQALGAQQRFNAPFPGSRGRRRQQSNLPFKLRLRDCHAILHIHDGYDWQHTRDGITDAVEQIELKAEERRARRRQSLEAREEDEPVVGDLLFNSIYIAVPFDRDAQELRRQINRNIDEMISETESVPVSGMSRPTTYSASGQPRAQRQRRRLKLGRSKNHKIAFELKGVSADVMVFPPGGGDVESSVDLRIKDLEIFDKVPSSTWRKFLTHLDTESATREMSKPMFHIQMDNVKTLESHSASEIVLKVSVLPLSLHVDQDALDFITRFFEFKDESVGSADPPGDPPFIQRVEVDTVDLCLDYKPKTIDYAGLRSGRTTEFMNFVTLNASNIRLKHAIVYGLRGFDTLHQTLNDVWMPDIQRNQLPTILAGLPGVRNLVNLGSGMRDVVAIPVKEYRKDGRIVRSIQKGAFQFGKTTASELAWLGAKVALGTQTMLSNAEQFMAPESSTSSRRPNAGLRKAEHGWQDPALEDEESEQPAVSAYANQPLGVVPGLLSARRHLEHDLLTARDALIAVRGEFFESRGPGGVAAAVARHAPTVILRPIIGATRAVGTTLLGVGNQIDRGNVRKVEDKYKPR